MATYSIDLGFDLELITSPANQEEALLAHGITFIGDVGNPVARLRRLQTQDALKVTVYQLGRESDVEITEITDMSFRISFMSSMPVQEHSSPVKGGDVLDQFKIFRCSYATLQSTVFEVARPLWFVEPDLGGRSYPQGQLQSETKDVGSDTFLLVNTGSFYFTMFLKVWFSRDGEAQEPKTFRVDPEMIVSTTGGSPGGGGKPC